MPKDKIKVDIIVKEVYVRRLISDKYLTEDEGRRILLILHNEMSDHQEDKSIAA